MEPSVLAFVALSAIAAGALAYAAMQPRLAKEKKVETRRAQFARSDNERAVQKVQRDRLNEQAKRRRQVQSSLKQMEERTREREKHAVKLSIDKRLAQAGVPISRRQFVWGSVVIGLLAVLVALVLGFSLPLALGIGVIAGLGMPRFLLARARKRRLDRFTAEFPNAIDLIVRGVKSGLPLNDTLRMTAAEAAEPVASEFGHVIEAQQMGLGTGEALERLYRSVPTPETNFFSIVIAIQAQAGGNLAEALANLSKVLRDRKKMRSKIQAMSMEAKASGAIIGSLPIIVGALVYLTTPDYIALLFTNPVGKIILLGSLFWMAIGVFVMKKMIAFDF